MNHKSQRKCYKCGKEATGVREYRAEPQQHACDEHRTKSYLQQYNDMHGHSCPRCGAGPRAIYYKTLRFVDSVSYSQRAWCKECESNWWSLYTFIPAETLEDLNVDW